MSGPTPHPASKAAHWVAATPPSNRRAWVGQVLGGALAWGAGGAAARAQTRSARGVLNLRLTHVVADDTPKGLAARRFAELVDARSGGRIRVQVYPNASLYGDQDEFQALQLGAVELIAPSLSKFGRVGFAAFELFDLPFTFASLAEVRRVCDGLLGQRLLASLHRHGLVGLGYFDNGFKQMSARRSLLEPADYRGLRMRVQASGVIAAQMRALGAEPVVLPFSETRAALAAGVVDGTENPLSNFWTQHMHQVQSDLTLTEHGYLGYAVVTHQRFWSALARADQRLLHEALGDALTQARQLSDAQNAQALAALQASRSTRIHRLDDAQRAHMRAAVHGLHAQLQQRIGADWLAELRKALGRYDNTA